ncbi:CHASE3 domain-containing protein [Hydrogenophaga sp. NFH-34]|uniref:CHASE3 domain-containing protein n=1 Tax=Hydrogenophaga sp. NFH-34 TaxID=2744446 RepID=UPI001F3D856B|nr:CHASE3 domain-containing protein [Hydrogenophaga sp. NFH-34]
MALNLERLTKWVSGRFIGPVAVSLAVMVLVISEAGFYRLQDISDNRESSIGTQMVVDGLRRTLLSMESASRGYMLTGRPDYLKPYHEQERSLLQMMGNAEHLAAEVPEQRDTLLQLVELARRKHSEMQTVLQRFDAGDRDGAIELTLTDLGREMMAQLNDLTDQIIRQEAARSVAYNHSRSSVLLWSRAGIWLLVLLCIGGAVALMHLSRHRERERRVYMLQLHAERDRLDEEVSRRTEETIELARHMERVREDERARLARELHDELGGLLTAAKLDLARIRKRIQDETGTKQQLVEHLRESLDAGIALKRRIIEDLRPSSLSNLGLKRTLQIQCAEFAQRAEVAVDVQLDDVVLSPERSLAVYRLVQEALTNVAKYAQARQVRVVLQREGEQVTVTVEDDGQGFDPSTVAGRGGHGLQGMRFRIRASGGDVGIRSAPGRGTTVHAVLPL